jgi:putative Mn2+ efflux pump MntP
MRSVKEKIVLIIVLCMVPGAVSAVTFSDFMGTFDNVIAGAVPIILSLAVITMFWGIAKYMRSAENSEERAKGRQFIVYAILALFVMFSLWGLVNVIVDSIFDPSDRTIDSGDVELDLDFN